jgi:hypothetical protein
MHTFDPVIIRPAAPAPMMTVSNDCMGRSVCGAVCDWGALLRRQAQAA